MGPEAVADVHKVEERPSGMRRRWVRIAALLLVVGLALALRMYGLDWDREMPFTPHPDERAILFSVAEISPPALHDLGSLLDADESSWNPRWFPYGSLPLYLLRGVQLVSEAVGKEVVDLRVTGRAISGIADVVTVLIVYLLGSRLYGRRVGVLAAGLLSVAVLHIQLSHFFAVDTLQAMFAVVSLLFLYRVARYGGVGNSALAGLFIGLGLATKASQLPIFLAFGVAQLMYLFDLAGSSRSSAESFRTRLRSVALSSTIGLLVALVAFFVTQPYALLDWGRYRADFTEQSEMVRRIRDYPYTRQYENTVPYWYFIQQNIVWGMGAPLGVLAWGGALFAAVRGLAWRAAVTYLALGLVLPAVILVFFDSAIAVVLAAAIATIALVSTLPVRRADTRVGVLLLSWVVPYFLITGSFEVKFMRYMIPITPVLVLFGSWLALSIWREGTRRLQRFHRGRYLRQGRWAMVAAAIFVIGSTGFYAVSYMFVYSDIHTAARASEWINANVRPASVVLKEHWEEGLPGLHSYRVRELPMYEPDGQVKLQALSEELAAAEALVFYSNRLYGTLPRLPERYPLSAAYYDLLFSGKLGYELAEYEATYPSFLGVTFVHDTFRRPGLPEPEPLGGFQPSAISLDLGHADESFSVYDHPTVMVFRNKERYDAGTIRKVISAEVTARISQERRSRGPVLSPSEFEIQREGGTWADVFAIDRWTSRVPILSWLLLVQGLALLALPLTLWLMRPLADRGYMFSKAIGILLVAVMVWLLASLQWVSFSPRAIALAALLLAAASVIVMIYRREDIVEFLRRRWSVLVIGEVVFLAAFFAFVGLRMANPDLWHPFRGGEKPMDLAYLNAVTRSTIMPPLDPWFAGGFINYYYFGQFITGMLIKATGIDVRVAYNLAIPLFFALTAGGAFSLAYNLTQACRGRTVPRRPGHNDTEPRSASPAGGSVLLRLWSGRLKGSLAPHDLGPVWAGLSAVALVAVLGNLDGAIQVGEGLANIVRGLPFGEFDFWRSSRMMPPDPPGFEITEFPFFTFLFADLHAHLMAVPFTLLALGLSLAVVLRRSESSLSWALLLVVLGLAVGVLRLINTWDYPTYLALAIAAIFLAGYFRHGGLGLSMLLRPAIEAAFVFLVGHVVFLPFHLRYETFFSSLEKTTNTTELWQFLAVSGLSVFILASYYAREGWSFYGARLRRLMMPVGTLLSPGRVRPAGAAIAAVLALAASAYGLVEVGGSTVPFVVVMLIAVVSVGVARAVSFGPAARVDAFVAAMIGLSLLLVLGVDFLRVEGDIDRMNTVFKTYLQVWVLMGVGSAYALWRLLSSGVEDPEMREANLADRRWRGGLDEGTVGTRPSVGWVLGMGRRGWILVLVLLAAGAAIYTVMGTQDRLRDRFQPDGQPLTLDGMAYMREATFTDEMGPVQLVHDYEAITWMQRNIEGTPVIVEANTPIYRWGGRVSIYTGLPSVAGWQWHQEQQRWDYRQDVAHRIYQVNTLYETEDPARALAVIERYDVDYVYVGELEKRYYPEAGIAKFEGALRPFLEPVYANQEVTLYRVVGR